ncbi:MAG: hypothetical protein U1F87_00050 [Kiritimatiellia bacterium]
MLGANYDLEITGAGQPGDRRNHQRADGAQHQVWGNNAKTLSLDGVISGAGRIRVEQNSTVVISQGNSFSGPTVINAGKITMGNNSALGTSAVTLNGGTLERNAAGVTVANNIAVSAGGGTLLGRQTVDDYATFSGQLTGSGALSVQGLVTLSNTGNTYSRGDHGFERDRELPAPRRQRGAGQHRHGESCRERLLSAARWGGHGDHRRAEQRRGNFVASAGNGTLKFGGNDGSTSFSGALSNGGSQLFLVKQGPAPSPSPRPPPPMRA